MSFGFRRLVATFCVVVSILALTMVGVNHQHITKYSHILRSIKDPNPSFRERFLQWDLHHPANIGRDAQQSGRYFIYRCDQQRLNPCGGWADRLKGAISGYVIANLTNRVFRAEFLKPPCDMSQYIVPNKVNWTVSVSQSIPKDMTIFNYINDERLKLKMSTMNFSEEYSPRVKSVYFLENLELISGIMSSSVYRKQLSWMRDLSPADVYAAIYKRLFKLAPRLHERLQKILSKNLPSKKHKLVCIHVRMGHNPSNKQDTILRNSLNNLPKIWSFIQKHSRSPLDKVFVMSDSQGVLDSAKKQSFSDRLVTIPGEIIHVDRFAGTSDAAACRGFEKLVMEHHLLMNCDLLVRGHSGLSVIASAVRGTDKDLYCLRESGDIEPCLRNEFDPAFL